MSLLRRDFLKTGASTVAGVAFLKASARGNDDRVGTALSNRVHLFAPITVKAELIHCFSNVLECGAPQSMATPGTSEPIHAFRFPAGGALSIEFRSDLIPSGQSFQGTWLEILTPNFDALRDRVLAVGYPRLHYPATNAFYFQAPGGQVIGIKQKSA